MERAANPSDQPPTLAELAEQRDNLTTHEYCHMAAAAWARQLDVNRALADKPPVHEALVNELDGSDEYWRVRGAAQHQRVNLRALLPLSIEYTPQVSNIPGAFYTDLRHRIGRDKAYDERMRARSRIEHNVLTQLYGEKRMAGDHGAYFTLIKTAHSCYTTMDRLAQTFGRMEIAEGMEQTYWQARLVGHNRLPGFAWLEGVAARFSQQAEDLGKKIYGDDAERALEIWWAGLNTTSANTPSPLTFTDLVEPLFRKMAEGNPDRAEYVLKEILYKAPDILNYPARRRFALQPDERAFFDELYAGTKWKWSPQ